MKTEHVIEFDLWEDAKPFEIALEPEATQFNVTYGKKLKFVATCNGALRWVVCMNKGGAIQLYPESKDEYEISVYENGKCIY